MQLDPAAGAKPSEGAGEDGLGVVEAGGDMAEVDVVELGVKGPFLVLDVELDEAAVGGEGGGLDPAEVGADDGSLGILLGYGGLERTLGGRGGGLEMPNSMAQMPVPVAMPRTRALGLTGALASTPPRTLVMRPC